MWSSTQKSTTIGWLSIDRMVKKSMSIYSKTQFNQESYIYDPSRVLNIFKDTEKIFSSNLYIHIKDYEDLLKEFVKNNEYGNLYVFQMIIVLLFSAGRGKIQFRIIVFKNKKCELKVEMKRN